MIDNNNNNKFQFFCKKCNKNICKKCYNICSEDRGHNKEKDFICFEDLDKDLKFEQEYIIKLFEKYFENESKKFIDNKEYQTYLSFLEEKNKKCVENIFDKVGNLKLLKMEEATQVLFERHLFITNLSKLFKTIFYYKLNFPNYSHYLNIHNIYDFLCDKLEIEYYSYSDQSRRRIKIFGKNFVEKNQKNCYLVIDNEDKDLCDEYMIEEGKKLEITLVKKRPITDVSEMFYKCDSLSLIKRKEKWTMDNVTDMHSMFYGCEALNDINDLFLDWNTSKVTDFSNMFYKCECLKDIKHISNFDTSNATNLNNMFGGCINLLKFDLSKWKTNKVIFMNNMFSNCENLTELIGLDKWNIDKVTYMNNMFENCSNLTDFSNIIKWNITKVLYTSKMFDGCNTSVEKPNWAGEEI